MNTQDFTIIECEFHQAIDKSPPLRCVVFIFCSFYRTIEAKVDFFSAIIYADNRVR